MQNEVTSRFLKCHDELMKRNIIKSTRQFALSLDVYPQNINSIKKGQREATVDMLQALVTVYNISSTYLMTGRGDIFDGEPNNDNIKYVPYAAHAGSTDQFFDTTQDTDMMRFSIPGYNSSGGEHRCFDVAGDSMEPSLYSGDKIICSQVSSDHFFSGLRDNYVYVVITVNEILVKRAVNKLKSHGHLLLISDNDFYKDIEIPGDELKEIWMVKMKISQFMPDPKHVRNGFSDEITLLKESVTQQQKHIATLNKSIETLLRKSR